MKGRWRRLGPLSLDTSRASWAASHAALPVAEPTGDQVYPGPGDQRNPGRLIHDILLDLGPELVGCGRIIDTERSRTAEIHHIEKRLDLDLVDEPPFYRPSAVIRAAGYLIVLAMVIAIWYSAVYS